MEVVETTASAYYNWFLSVLSATIQIIQRYWSDTIQCSLRRFQFSMLRRRWRRISAISSTFHLPWNVNSFALCIASRGITLWTVINPRKVSPTRDYENGALARCIARKCNKLHNEHSSSRAPVRCSKIFMLQVRNFEDMRSMQTITWKPTFCHLEIFEKLLFSKFTRKCLHFYFSRLY